MARLTSRFLIDLLVRRTEAAGGFAAILARGDDHAGAILIECAHRGVPGALLERRFSGDGYIWESVGPDATDGGESRQNYRDRRQKADPDLWIVELDIVDATQFIADWTALT